MLALIADCSLPISGNLESAISNLQSPGACRFKPAQLLSSPKHFGSLPGCGEFLSLLKEVMMVAKKKKKPAKKRAGTAKKGAKKRR
jgi:hypothetical protein